VVEGRAHFHRGNSTTRESAVEGRVDQQDYVLAQRSGAAHRYCAQPLPRNLAVTVSEAIKATSLVS